ncbi:hypothetical protein K469DRAFT_706215 [Zopfia rhizophila CBS 207.26]|uniref:Protein kinase domain-containing protein n=1 Tax=Zopfia rhizophila CBS 207.26 TaxID=1314779 RepID=A0A6A6ETW9_9PEZI|nr:hypothetical protein K469DRAFT_706215 [Zopfia rhizophila CBS 207.26]
MPDHREPSPSGTPESYDAIENAFARLPRPQKVLDLTQPHVPTKYALMQAKAHAESVPLKPTTATDKLIGETPHRTEEKTTVKLDELITLGKFAQGGVQWEVRARRGQSTLIMVRELGKVDGLREKDMLEQISHRNIAKIDHTFWKDESLCIGIEYCRPTLGEILHVHLKLEEQQVQYIARSIFQALSYLGNCGITHHKVGLKSIRLAVPDLRIVLSNFECATKQDLNSYSNADLIDLGFVVLDCMEGRSQPDSNRNIQFIKNQRAANKVFGLSKPERWSGCKQLVDFLDDLFNDKRSAPSKLSKPHRFIFSAQQDPECMRPYVELVTFECFTPWVAGE